MRARLEPAALVCSLLAEIHRDPDKRDRPYTVSDFLPGDFESSAPIDGKEANDEMKAFIDAIQRGESMEQTQESIEALKNSLKDYAKPTEDCGKATQIGPRGKMERA